jgi:hypothetical protein
MTKFLKIAAIGFGAYVLFGKGSAAAPPAPANSTKLQPAPTVTAVDPFGNPIATRPVVVPDDPAIISGAPLISPLNGTPLPISGHPGIFVLNAPVVESFPSPSFSVPVGAPSASTLVQLPTPSGGLATLKQTLGISFPRAGDTIAL